MSPENVRNRKKNRRLTFVMVPSGESEKTRTFSISRPGLILSGIVSFIVIIVGVFALIVYTPARSLLPVSNPELEKRYGTQIFQIQEQVKSLVNEMNVLRNYNLRLRKALGESLPGSDSAVVSQQEPKPVAVTPSQVEPRNADESGGATSAPDLKSVNHDAEIQASSDERTDVQAGSIPLMREFPLTKPAEGYVARGFDSERFHYGIDYAGKKSSAVLAAADGQVVFSGWTYDDGYMIMIAHDLGYMTVYKHNESLLKNSGVLVRRGEPIALLGNTGRTSSGPHLHFEVWKNGVAQDPGQYMLSPQ